MSSFSKLSVTSPTSQLIFQPFRDFTYITAHSPTLLFLDLRHSSFSNPCFASPTSQLILQPLFCFSYVTGFSLTSPGEPPMIKHFLKRNSKSLKQYSVGTRSNWQGRWMHTFYNPVLAQDYFSDHEFLL